MEEVLQFGGFLLMDYAAMVVYAKRAVRYSKSFLDAQRPENSAAFYGASLLFLWMVVFSGLPVIVIFLFLYSALLLYFLLFFGNGLPVALFASGTFMFHIADLYMLLFGIFSLNCDICSMEAFRGNYRYLVLVLLVILVSTLCEFLAILPDKTEQEAAILMEEACRNMEEDFHRQDIAFGPSVSYGIVQLDQLAAGSVSGLLELADRRMYEMKRKQHKMRQ